MLLLLLSQALAAPLCPASGAEVDATVAEAEAAFGQLDEGALTRALSDAMVEVACLREPIPPVVAARLHRAQALRAFVLGKDGEARRALHAATVLDPSGDFPLSLIPADHPIRGLRVAPAGQPAQSSVPPASDGLTVYFDGSATLSRPADRPTVFQVADAGGSMLQGQYLTADTALPPYARGPKTASATVQRPKPRLSVPLAILGGAAVLAGGAAYAGAGVSHAAFEDPETRVSELEGLRDRTNTLVYASAGLVGVGVASGLGAVVVASW
jgi:hypothetical protein